MATHAPRLITWLVLMSCAVGGHVSRVGAKEAEIDFNHQIRPILSSRCLICHGPDEEERATDLRLDTQDGSRIDLGGYAAIVPGDPSSSEMIARLTSDDEDERMPPADHGSPLSRGEVNLIRQWIQQGAEYAEHWSYKKPIRPPLPRVKQQQWPRSAIDYFVLAQLEAKGVTPSDEAGRLVLARRASLDLTGLPPTWKEAQAFASDPRADAYERYIDRLLAKPAFGERWARVWLDLARYADSAGYADDPPRTIWAFRDYVIQSFNENKPFDEFTIEQIAGDLLENPTTEQLIATAFHRNTMTNNEGGTNNEEFRNVAIVDRVNTTMAVWMGTTMACAQCHTHKYDPITQEEYFQFFAFFNDSEDADLQAEQPFIRVWTEQQKVQKKKLDEQIAELKLEVEATVPALDSTKEELAKREKQLASIEPYATVPIMRDLVEAKHRTTKIQIRGNYKSTGKLVSQATPAAFHPLRADRPRDRLALAEWLIDEANPLTARVIANRHWEQIFGKGIVETSEEFGSQGELPSHPLLLDWLAVELRDGGWDLKHLLKLLVMSATYRQSSVTSAEQMEGDPYNRLLARGPRFRISAEMVRDQALFIAGLLSDKMYGPPVNPPQPDLGLKAAFGASTDWKTSGGEDRYRRGVYTRWRRSSPYPSMAQFDAPNREVCTIRRIRTNTPLQALVTLNDPVYIEAAQALARRMIAAGESAQQRIEFGFHASLTRDPTPKEVERLLQLVETVTAKYQNNSQQATLLATDSAEKLPEQANASELAAWTIVGNVILNLDEVFLKR